MRDSDGGISIWGQAQVKPAGADSERVIAAALSTSHISQMFYASPREFVFILAGQAVFFVCLFVLCQRQQIPSVVSFKGPRWIH